MNISEFRKNEVITRTQESLNGSCDFIHTKMVYVGIERGFIILHSPYGKVSLIKEDWFEGWSYFLDYSSPIKPKSSLEKERDSAIWNSVSKKKNQSKEEMLEDYKLQLDEAIHSENYERASELKKKIESKEKEINLNK